MSDIAPTEIIATQPRALSPQPKRIAFDGLRPILERLRSFTAEPAVARSLPAIGLITALGIAAMIWMAFSSPPSRNLFSALADQDKGKVVEALGAAGINYAIDQSSGALTVAEADYHQARILLASQGLPKGAPDGNEMISNLPLGASRAVEGERLRAAKEVDLARSIEAIDAVEGARVHLALEAPSVFLRDRSKRSASVVLRLVPGRVLGAEQVQAIVHLVASSVPGLATDGVSIIDQSGKLLSSGAGDGSGALSERQLAVQSAVEERHRRALEALLTPLVGAGNFTAEVHADLDFSETQATRESYPKEASTLRSEEGSWTGAGQQEAPAGIPGALSNQAPPATVVAAAPGGTLDPNAPEAGTAAAVTVGKAAENYTRNFATGREVSVSRQAPGQVQRLSVAVALRQPAGSPRSRQELAEIESLVKGAIGFKAARGDVVALSARNFAAVPETGANWWDASWVALVARNLSALAIAAVLILGIVRPLMRRRSAVEQAAKANAKPAAGGQAALTASAPAFLEPVEPEPSPADVTLRMIESAPSYEARAVLIRNFVRQDPARAAIVVRDLLRDDKADGADKHG